MKKLSVIHLFSYMILMLPICLVLPAFGDENSFVISKESGELFGQIKVDLGRLESGDRTWDSEINASKEEIIKAKTVREKKFRELDYYEKCASRINMWIRGLKSTLGKVEKELANFNSGIQKDSFYENEGARAEIEGIHSLLTHVITCVENGDNIETIYETPDHKRYKIVGMTYQNVLATMNRPVSDERTIKLRETIISLKHKLFKYAHEYQALRRTFEQNFG